MPVLPPAALTTVAAVLDELDLEDDGGPIRARLERYIASASAVAASIIGRAVHYDAAFIETVDSRGVLFLHRTPIVALATVVTQGGVGLGVAGAIIDADLGIVTRGVVGWPDGSVTATYAGGWVTPTQAATLGLPQTLPLDVEDAVIQLVTSRYRRRGKDAGIVGESFTGSTFTYDGQAVPASIMGILAAHQHIANA